MLKRGRETELAQGSLLPLTAAGGGGVQALNQISSPTSSGVSLPAVAQTSEPDHPELHEAAWNIRLEEFLHELLTQLKDDKQAQATLDPDDQGEQRDQAPKKTPKPPWKNNRK